MRSSKRQKGTCITSQSARISVGDPVIGTREAAHVSVRVSWLAFLRISNLYTEFWGVATLNERPCLVHSKGTPLRRFHISSLGNVQVLPLCFCFCHSLEEVEVGFGVRELFDLLNLQAFIFIGNDMCGPDHFAVHLHPN